MRSAAAEVTRTTESEAIGVLLTVEPPLKAVAGDAPAGMDAGRADAVTVPGAKVDPGRGSTVIGLPGMPMIEGTLNSDAFGPQTTATLTVAGEAVAVQAPTLRGVRTTRTSKAAFAQEALLRAAAAAAAAAARLWRTIMCKGAAPGQRASGQRESVRRESGQLLRLPPC